LLILADLPPPTYRGNPKRDWKTSRSAAIKILTEADVDNYKVSDVVLPLPGHDIQYPTGPLYEKIQAIMGADELDPAKMQRDQKWVGVSSVLRKALEPG
jgi:tRNA pseudouridine13 synthase